jgi:hypothetical protein
VARSRAPARARKALGAASNCCGFPLIDQQFDVMHAPGIGNYRPLNEISVAEPKCLSKGNITNDTSSNTISDSAQSH